MPAALSVVILVFLAAQVLIFALIFRLVSSRIRQLERTVRDFVTAPDDKTPSPLATMVDQASQLVGRAVIAQARATFMGEASAMAKAAGKAQSQEALNKVPWLAAIAGIAPGFSKTLARNPALLNLGASLASQKPAGNGHSPAPAQAPRFDL